MGKGSRRHSAFCKRCKRNVSIPVGISRHEKQGHASCKAQGCTWTGLTNELDDHRKIHSPAHLLSTLEEVLERVGLRLPTEWPKKLRGLHNLRAPNKEPCWADEGHLANRPHQVQEDLDKVCRSGLDVMWDLVKESLNSSTTAPLQVRSSFQTLATPEAYFAHEGPVLQVR